MKKNEVYLHHIIDAIAHDYLNIDVQVVWEVVQHDLPGLQSYVRRMLDGE
jgi:uncharacterized protein with HEPN domain